MILFRSTLYFIFLVLNTLLIAGIGTLIGWAIPEKKI